MAVEPTSIRKPPSLQQNILTPRKHSYLLKLSALLPSIVTSLLKSWPRHAVPCQHLAQNKPFASVIAVTHICEYPLGNSSPRVAQVITIAELPGRAASDFLHHPSPRSACPDQHPCLDPSPCSLLALVLAPYRVDHQEIPYHLAAVIVTSKLTKAFAAVITSQNFPTNISASSFSF